MQDSHRVEHYGRPYGSSSGGPPNRREISSYPDPQASYHSRGPMMPGLSHERPPLPAFFAPSDPGSISPNDHSANVGEAFRVIEASGAPSPVHVSAMAMHNPKRAYRQRRKDPSCDACRERKVKCDATDTSSCTECSSRNVRCQFTKDTNRRMSSIKQVQDLERQLLEARQQLDHVHTKEAKSDYFADFSTDTPVQPMSEIASVGRSPRRMLKARTPQDLSYARAPAIRFWTRLTKAPCHWGAADTNSAASTSP